MEIALKQALECVIKASAGGNIGTSRCVVEAMQEGYNADLEEPERSNAERKQFFRKGYVNMLKTVKYFRY